MSEVDKQKRERVSQRVKELRQKASTNEKTISRRTSSVSDFSPISSAPQSGTATPTTTTSTIDSGSRFDFTVKQFILAYQRKLFLPIFCYHLIAIRWSWVLNRNNSISSSYRCRSSFKTIEKVRFVKAKQSVEMVSRTTWRLQWHWSHKLFIDLGGWTGSVCLITHTPASKCSISTTRNGFCRLF